MFHNKSQESEPPWMNLLIKQKIQGKYQIYRASVKNGCKGSDHVKFQEEISIGS